MTAQTDSLYHMSESGLDNLFLSSGFRVHKTAYGAGVSFEDEDALLRAAATERAKTPTPLTGRELKVLRIEAGFTQEWLGEKLGVSSQAIAKWEKKESEALRSRDALSVRALVLSKLAPSESVGALVHGGNDKIVMNYSPEFGWRRELPVQKQHIAVYAIDRNRYAQDAQSTYYAELAAKSCESRVANDETYSRQDWNEGKRTAA